MKNNQIKLTNPNPYTLDILIRNLNLSIKIENPNGLNNQKITITYKRKRSKTYDPANEKYELTPPELEYIKYYLEAEGYTEEAKRHNLYFE